MRRKFFVVHIVLLNLLFCSAAYSCSYANTWWKTNPPCAKFNNAKLVALGRVTKVEIRDNADKETIRSDKVQVLRFAVEESFKGAAKKVIYLRKSYGSSCDYNSYKVGDKLLVYSNTVENSSRIYDMNVAHTFPNSDDFEKELKYCRLAKKGQAGATISNVFVKFNREKINHSAEDTGIAGVNVLLEGPKSKYKVKTDADGKFLLYGLAAGTYKISTDLLDWNGEKMSGEITLEKDGCEETHGAVSEQSAVKGTLLKPDGNFAAEVELQLIAIDPETNSPGEDSLSVFTNENGEFEFMFIPAGKYMLAHNFEDKGYSDSPKYETSFYPGTNDIGFGSIIEVNNRQDLNLGIYKLTGAAQ